MINSILMCCQSGKQMYIILTHIHVCFYIHVLTVYTLTVTYLVSTLSLRKDTSIESVRVSKVKCVFMTATDVDATQGMAISA